MVCLWLYPAPPSPSGFDVLIASDAVGMGLNLNIRRIVFSTIHKFDGNEVREASVEEVRGQIIRLVVLYAPPCPGLCDHSQLSA